MRALSGIGGRAIRRIPLCLSGPRTPRPVPPQAAWAGHLRGGWLRAPSRLACVVGGLKIAIPSGSQAGATFVLRRCAFAELHLDLLGVPIAQHAKARAVARWAGATGLRGDIGRLSRCIRATGPMRCACHGRAALPTPGAARWPSAWHRPRRSAQWKNSDALAGPSALP